MVVRAEEEVEEATERDGGRLRSEGEEQWEAGGGEDDRGG